MVPHTGHSGESGEHASRQLPLDTHSEFRRLLSTLAARSRRLGSRDPESAAQETLKRSLQNVLARPAVEFYFSRDRLADAATPAWPLDQLFAWLHGVLHHVVQEEHSRAGSRRELPIRSEGHETGRAVDHADPAPDQLELLLDREMKRIVADSFAKLGREYRTVLRMRVDGMKYVEIAGRLGVSENTVATWVSRGIRDLAQIVRRRTMRCIPPGGLR